MRTAEITRVTAETDIRLTLTLDGTGIYFKTLYFL